MASAPSALKNYMENKIVTRNSRVNRVSFNLLLRTTETDSLHYICFEIFNPYSLVCLEFIQGLNPDLFGGLQF